MKATLYVELKPFTVPNFVRAVSNSLDADDETVAYPLSSLDASTLDRLCDQFRDEVFKKAGKQQPPSAAP